MAPYIDRAVHPLSDAAMIIHGAASTGGRAQTLASYHRDIAWCTADAGAVFLAAPRPVATTLA